jgi:hypothetical protein
MVPKNGLVYGGLDDVLGILDMMLTSKSKYGSTSS